MNVGFIVLEGWPNITHYIGDLGSIEEHAKLRINVDNESLELHTAIGLHQM